jgi:hypothetical protein
MMTLLWLSIGTGDSTHVKMDELNRCGEGKRRKALRNVNAKNWNQENNRNAKLLLLHCRQWHVVSGLLLFLL